MAQEGLDVDTSAEKRGLVAATIELSLYPVVHASHVEVDMGRIHSTTELVNQLLRMSGICW